MTGKDAFHQDRNTGTQNRHTRVSPASGSDSSTTAETEHARTSTHPSRNAGTVPHRVQEARERPERAHGRGVRGELEPDDEGGGEDLGEPFEGVLVRAC